MRVGILTFPNSRSYGAALQMYGLYQTCQNLGYDAEIMNYFNHWMKQERHTTNGKELSRSVLWVKRNMSNLLHIRMKRHFKQFENEMVKYPKSATTDIAQLPVLAKRYGAVICGSDQVWNPDITNKDLSYFLNFCGPETVRISFAPSFGVESLPESYANTVRSELEAFDHLSVREETGKNLIREISGLDAKLVIDPTLLLNADQWQKYEKRQSQAKGEYILYYTIRSSRTLWKHCLDLARKTNMKILRIGSNMISSQFKKTYGVEYVCDAGPAEWLYLVRNASYVVTNSFHGTAFSVNFRKNFYVEFSSFTNSRLSNIVNLLGLEERVLWEGMEISPSSTDYSKTESVLPQLVEESTAFLIEALKDAAMKQEEYHA